MDSKERLRLRDAAAAVIGREVAKIAVDLYRQHAGDMFQAVEQAKANWEGHDDKGIEQVIRKSDWSRILASVVGVFFSQDSAVGAERMADFMISDGAYMTTHQAVVEIHGQY